MGCRIAGKLGFGGSQAISWPCPCNRGRSVKYLLWLTGVLLASGAQTRDAPVSVYPRGQR